MNFQHRFHRFKTPVTHMVLGGILMLSSQSTAATYYLNSNTGDDSRTAQQAQSLTSPAKSVIKLKGLSLSAGDQILLEQGGIYPGTLSLGEGATVSGSSGNPVVVGGYGMGAPPLISGTKVVTGTWTKSQGNIWVTPVTDSVEQLFFKGVL